MFHTLWLMNKVICMKYFVLFSLLVLLSCSWGIDECVVDDDCAVGYRCFEGNCIEVICPIGHTVENHTCVYASLDSSTGATIEERFPAEETEPEPEIVEEPTVEIEEPVVGPESETDEINETKETIEEGTDRESVEEPEGGMSAVLLLIIVIIIGSAIVVYMTYFKKIR